MTKKTSRNDSDRGMYKVFYKESEKFTSDKIVLETLKLLDVPFKKVPRQRKKPVTVPQSKEKYQSLETEIENLLQKGNKIGSSQK